MDFLILFSLVAVAAIGLAKDKAIPVAIACGAGLGLVSPPNGFWWLHWVLWVPVLLVLKEGQNKRNFRIGYLTGLVALSICFFWISEAITHYSNLPRVLALLAVLLFAAAYALLSSCDLFGLAFPGPGSSWFPQ